MARYAACFRPRLHGQLAHCQQYVKGLFHACRSNVERMNERLPDSNYDALHHFISLSDWDGQAVMDEVARQVQATLAAETGEVDLLLGKRRRGAAQTAQGRDLPRARCSPPARALTRYPRPANVFKYP